MLIPIAVTERHWTAIRVLALLAVVVGIFLSLGFGAVRIDLAALFSIFGNQADAQSLMIVRDLRLPRAILAAVVGALLAACGTLTQGLFRNPLADPSLIGVSAGAAAGASFAIVMLDSSQWSLLGLSFVSFGAFIGGIAAVVFVFRIATGLSGTSVATMLLAGIAVTFLAGSISSIFEFVADNEMLRRISLWRMGGLDSADYVHLMLALPVAAIIFALLPQYYSSLNAFLLGESEARHLGIDTDRVKKQIVIIVAAGVGISVALAGTIAFIGLVVPHLVRILVGPNHRFLLPLSACCGALLLVVADIFARTLLAPAELPVGLMTAFVGAPVFVSLLRKRHHYGMQ